MTFLVQPAATWRPHIHQPVKRPMPSIGENRPSPSVIELRWFDHAEREEWREALLAFLQENWRGRHELWKVVNSVVAEARPETRSEVRKYTTQVLHVLMELVRERKVMRYRRRWVAGLERSQEITPLDEIPTAQLART